MAPRNVTAAVLVGLARQPGDLGLTKGEQGIGSDGARLRQDIRAWVDAWNTDPTPFVWIKTAEEIFDSIASYLQRTSDSGH